MIRDSDMLENWLVVFTGNVYTGNLDTGNVCTDNVYTGNVVHFLLQKAAAFKILHFIFTV